MVRSICSAAARAWSRFGKLAWAKSGFPPPLPRNSGATDWRISATSTGTPGPRDTTKRTSVGALAHRMAVAFVSEAIAFDMDIMKPTPSPTSCLTSGHAALVVRTASRAFTAACSSVARCESFRSSFHSPLRNLDNAQLAAGHRSALVEPNPELPLREIAGQALGAHLSRGQDLVVGELFDLQQLGVRQRIEVRDVESSHVDGLMGARLPDVVSEHLARGAQDDVGGRVVSREGLPSIRIDRARHRRSPKTTGVAAGR